VNSPTDRPGRLGASALAGAFSRRARDASNCVSGETPYRVFWTPEDAAPVPAEVRTLTSADRDAVLALHQRITGEDRSLAVNAALEGAVATPDLSAVALRPPWPARPILAREPAAGAELLGATLAPGLRLAVPETNEPAVAAMRALGCADGEAVVRMRRGAPVRWRPDELWGVFSLFFG